MGNKKDGNLIVVDDELNSMNISEQMSLALSDFSVTGLPTNTETISQMFMTYHLLPLMVGRLSKKFIADNKESDGVIVRNILRDYGDVKHSLTVEIYPKIEKGKPMYPGQTEEVVESALIYLACQGYGVVSPNGNTIGVKFTLPLLRSICANVLDRNYNYSNIKHSLSLLSSCSLVIKGDVSGKLIHVSETRLPRFHSLLDDSRRASNSDIDNDTVYYAEFHSMLVNDLVSAAYTLIDTEVFRFTRGEIDAAIVRRLIIIYKQANFSNTYHFKASDIINSTSLYEKQQSRESFRVYRDIQKALERLEMDDFIVIPDADEGPEPYRDITDYNDKGRKIVVDRIYVVFAGSFLARMQKKLNSLRLESKTKKD